jgi:hypothetical protein
MMREINPLTLFIKFIPATYDVKKDCGLVVQRQSLFAVVTVVPAPGVDVWRCYESVCRECPCSIARDERLMLLARMRMYATDIDCLKVGERNRRIPLDGVNPFVRSAHEFETVNNILSMLNKRHGDAISNCRVIGVAHPDTPEEFEKHKAASDGYIARTKDWRTKFTSACDLKRQDAANLFPWIPKMSVYRHHEGDANAPFPQDRFGYIEGVITMELFQPLDVSPTMKFEDFMIGEYPESVKAACMRFAYKCDMSSQGDSCFLLDKNSRKPLENYVNELHGGVSTALPFSYPGALKQYLQAHEKHQDDKQNEATKAMNLYNFAHVTSDGLNQGLCYGSLVLATHIARMKSGYYRSDTIDGMIELLDFIMETTSDGCNFNRLLCDARAEYESDILEYTKTDAGKKRDVTGVQFWRALHGHNLLLANRFYTMHACNLNAFEEMLTR